jgi:tRNA-splicing ligase RtcB (3'-phosphate/5'-hydroxy nucleic acid ligase)
MPDCHVGSGICIGYTTTITDKVVPYYVGSDVGCGVIVQTLKDKHIELDKLDKIMHSVVPSGFAINSKPHRFANQIDIAKLKCYSDLKNPHKFILGIGSLGSGNHYCEVNTDETGQLFLVIHTGSRNLGKQIADYYQQKAYDAMKSKRVSDLAEILDNLKKNGKVDEIDAAIKYFHSNNPEPEKAMAYCEGQLMDDYLHDMAIAQEYASLNRKAIADIIQRGVGWKVDDEFQTIHNYIDMDTKILRKGAVRAEKGEILIIPANMKDGSMICVGKGNEDYNYSAPHGCGRLMSRKKAKETFGMDEFRASMEGIYTTCVNKDTLDESPMSYKPMQEIIDNIGDTVDIVNIIKPIYNFKAGEESGNRRNKHSKK